MKRSSCVAGLLCSVILSSAAYADLLCVQAAYQGGAKVKLKSKTVAAAKCPKGYVKIVNTSTFVGPQGAPGTDGQLRVYGNGSAGAKTVGVNETLGADAAPENDSNLQYTDFVVSAGVKLTVPSGTVIRCTGVFANHGTIEVQTGAAGGSGAFSNLILPGTGGYNFRGGPAHPGVAASAAGDGPRNQAASGFTEGGTGGDGLSAFQARQLLKPGIFGGGGGGAGGYRTSGLLVLAGSNSGGAGGGSFVVIAQGGIVNDGVLTANGGRLNAGGGAGGAIILASKTSVTTTASSVIEAKGADGDDAGTDAGPSGGGGGGIVHLIAPTVDTAAGLIRVNGGAAGATSANVVTGTIRYGGGGGGACGGSGGNGGGVDGGNWRNSRR